MAGAPHDEGEVMSTHGEKRGFVQIARTLRAPLLRYLQRQVGDQTMAEDLLQETLLRVGCGLSEFAGRASVKTWVFSIASNVAMDYLRQPAHRLMVVEIEEAANVPTDEVALDDRLVIDEMNLCVREVIDSLSADYRTALILHDFEGMSVEQTAEICQCALPTAKIRIYCARQRLKDALGRQCDFYRDSGNVFRCTRSIEG